MLRPGKASTSSLAIDGFTLRDLVSYSHKHNMRNGEQGRDGTDANGVGTAAKKERRTTKLFWLYVGVRCAICWR